MDFSIHNLPFGVFRTESAAPRAGIAFEDRIVDLAALARRGQLDVPDPTVFEQKSLNAFIALGKPYWRAVRQRVASLLPAAATIAQRDATMLLPVEIGDYVDFYSSEEHATNLGTMFRGPENPLLPNWKHLPVGYHGRCSSIVVSGQDIRRPKGQLGAGEFGPSRRLDFELEMGFIVSKATELGTSVTVNDAEDHIFGLAMINDWSARDIQRWEYQPLGPFLAKSFATSMSPWIVPLEALEPFRTEGPRQDPEPLPYLRSSAPRTFDIRLEVLLNGAPITRSNFRHLYWNMSQQLAHLTSNGGNLRVGDLCASGTISGPTPDSYGSMVELSWNGTKPLKLPDGQSRTFLEDGDEVTMRAWSEREGIRVSFGELTARVLPAL